jgi:hypothetical protein
MLGLSSRRRRIYAPGRIYQATVSTHPSSVVHEPTVTTGPVSVYPDTLVTTTTIGKPVVEIWAPIKSPE